MWPAVVMAGVTDLSSPFYTSDPFDTFLFVWGLIVVWPLWVFFVLPGAALLAKVASTPRIFHASRFLLAVAAAITAVVVANSRASDDSQAGVGYIYLPLFGLGLGLLVAAGKALAGIGVGDER